MALIGQLAVNVVAKTFGFNKAIDKSRKKALKFGLDVNNVGSELRRLGGLALGAAGIAGIGSFVSSQLKAIDSLGKVSDKLGISTEKLGAFRHAAELSGVTSTALDTSLQRMTRRVTEAGRGTGEAAGALAELGLNAKELARFDPATQFERIGEAVNKLGRQGDKIRIAQKIFDTEGVALVNTFAAGLKLAENNYKRLGLATTGLDTKKIEALNDQVSILGQRLAAAGKRILIDLAPAMSEAIGGLSIIAEKLGIIRPVKTARDQAREAKIGANAAKKSELETPTARDVIVTMLALNMNHAQSRLDHIRASAEELALRANQSRRGYTLYGSPQPQQIKIAPGAD